MRGRVIWLALAGTLLACWWVEQAEQPSEPGVTEVSTRVQRRSMPLPAAMPATKALESALPAPVQTGTEEEAPAVNLFAALPVPDVTPAAAQPASPVNPYQYAGRLLESGRWIVFLTDGQQQYVLQAGDRFAEGWQVAALDQDKVVLQHAGERFEIRLDDGVVF